MEHKPKTISTLDDHDHCLTRKADAIVDINEGLTIAKSLEESLLPLMPAAGLAAPQIGIPKQVFIFTWDRSVENLEAVINPTLQPIDEEKRSGWEGCFSVPLALANVPRYQNILVTYTNRESKTVTYKLHGFAARVFQHEYDHLHGIENIHQENAQVKLFDTRENVIEFIKEVRRADAVNYLKPILVGE